MTIDLDPQIAAALAPLMADAGDIVPPPAGDVEARIARAGHHVADQDGCDRIRIRLIHRDTATGRVHPRA